MASPTRTTVWSDNQSLTAAALNGEFNHLLDAINIVNADISGSAAIAYTKLALTGSIVNADISSGAAILASKIQVAGSAGQYLTTNGTNITYTTLPTQTLYRSFAFFNSGYQAVSNDVSWNPISPQAVTAIKLWAYCKTAPTGANYIAQVYDVTQSRIVATVTITAAATSGNNASMTNAAIAQGDVLRMDVTQVGSTVVGVDVSLVLECTQP